MARVTYKIAASGRCETAARTTIGVGHHSFVIDEPKERHGTDQGATPLEYLVGSFVGCTNVIASRIANEMGIQLLDMHISAEAEVDGRVLQGVDTPVAFPALRLKVTAKSNATPDQVHQLKAVLAKRCPVSVLFRQSGTNVVEDWEVHPL